MACPAPVEPRLSRPRRDDAEADPRVHRRDQEERPRARAGPRREPADDGTQPISSFLRPSLRRGASPSRQSALLSSSPRSATSPTSAARPWSCRQPASRSGWIDPYGRNPKVDVSPRFPRGSNRSAAGTGQPGSDLISRRGGTPGRTRTCDLWVRNLRVVRPPSCVASTASAQSISELGRASTPSMQRTPSAWSAELRGVLPTNCPRRCSTVYRE